MKRKTCALYNLLQVDTAILYYQSTEATPQAGPDQILSHLPPRHNKTTKPLSFLGKFGFQVTAGSQILLKIMLIFQKNPWVIW